MPCAFVVPVVFAIDPPETVYFADGVSLLTVTVTVVPVPAGARLIFGVVPPSMLALTEPEPGRTLTFEGVTGVVRVVPVLAVVSSPATRGGVTVDRRRRR